MTNADIVASVADADWFNAPALQLILSLLNREGGEARIVGGAVRNTLMGLPASDVDIATTLTPDVVVTRAIEAGLKTVPTGIQHGTVTLIVDGHPFEVTTLRVDVATDGRHAQVAFGTDWKQDAQRRDLTVNALYADASGQIVDLVGGVADLRAGRMRFIGDATSRIEEDYLRILRFFRFHAWYGEGRPDADGLRACARLKSGLANLSAERVWAELKKMLGAPDPGRALLWMRQTGVLTEILPESEKWGIDAVFGVIESQNALGWPADPLLRLMSIIPPDEARLAALAARLKMSGSEKDRLLSWAAQPAISEDTADIALKRDLYLRDAGAIEDRLRLQLSRCRTAAGNDDKALLSAGKFARLLAVCLGWVSPQFPISGKDLLAAGVLSGRQMGECLRRLEETWVASDFTLTRQQLLDKISDIDT